MARFQSKLTKCSVLLLALAFQIRGQAQEHGPYQATGFKVGEVDDRSAIVWTRLTKRPERNPSAGPQVTIEYEEKEDFRPNQRPVKAIHFPNGCTVESLKEAVPGVDGDVRVLYRTGDESWLETPWLPVDPLSDFTRQFRLDRLKPATMYQVKVESRSLEGESGLTLDGHFRTAPSANDIRPVRFAVVTCFGNDDQDCPEGFKLYPAITALDVDFLVHTGDIVYYDQLGKTVDLARYHWQRMYSWPTNVAFHRGISSYFIKDDHDTWVNDSWPTMKTDYMGDFTFRQGQLIFREQVPMGRSTYRTFRWGKDLQIWLVEGRDFRSPTPMADGPEKTIWGMEQKKWFKQTVQNSNATFKVLLSPTPLIGPDRPGKRDNHSNQGFAHEGKELREFLAENKMVVICGDRHWQYMSVDPDTDLREYSVGPGSDSHAGGWKLEDFIEKYHRYLRVLGGFVTVDINRSTDDPEMTIRFHDTDGQVKYEDVVRK